MRKLIAGLVFISLVSSCSMFFDADKRQDGSKGLKPLSLIGGGTLSDDVAQDQHPFLFRHNGKTYIIFSSDRGTPGDMNLWYAEMDAEGNFTEPQSLPTNNINLSNYHEISPALFTYNSNVYLVYISDLKGSSCSIQTWLLDNDLTPVSNVDYTDLGIFQITAMGLLQDSVVPTVMLASGSTSARIYNFTESGWVLTNYMSFDGITISSISGFYLDGTEYYIASSTKMPYGVQQLLYGSSLTKGVLTPVPFYASEFDDFSPFIDTETYKVYFASDRYGFGNFDLYRYNYLTYDLLMTIGTYIPPLSNIVYLYVGTNGNDANSGTNPLLPLRSINTAAAKTSGYDLAFIQVSEGLYSNGDGLNTSGTGLFITNNNCVITLTGGYDLLFIASNGVSILEGNNILDHVVQVSNAYSAIMSGFVIRGGQAGGIFPDDMGGGVLINNSILVTIADTVISNNNANNGGGIAVYNSWIVLNGFVMNNTASYSGGGIFITNSLGGSIEGVIADNLAYGFNPSEGGGGIYINGFSSHLITAQITGNYAYYGGGGIYDASSSLTVDGSIIIGNSAMNIGSAILVNYSPIMSLEIINNIITNNDSAGGVIQFLQVVDSSFVYVTNNFIGGSAAAYGTGIYEGADVTNHFLAGNYFITNMMQYVYYDTVYNYFNATNINNFLYSGAIMASGNVLTNM